MWIKAFFETAGSCCGPKNGGPACGPACCHGIATLNLLSWNCQLEIPNLTRAARDLLSDSWYCQHKLEVTISDVVNLWQSPSEESDVDLNASDDRARDAF